jgi:two-component system, sensor histidine kinase
MNIQQSRQTLFEELVFPINNDNLRIRAGQLLARMQMYPVVVGSQAVLEPLFVWLMWSQAPLHGVALMSWLAAMYAMHALEMFTWWRYRNELDTVGECVRWKWRFNFFTVVIGLAWGSTSLWLSMPDLAHQALLICVMLGLAAGAATMNPVFPPSLYIFVLSIMVPLTVRIMQGKDETHWVLSIMLVLYLISVLRAGRELGQTFWLSLKQRYENLFLVEQLTEQKKLADLARQQAETASREKSRFLAAASHDLRQPLQALALFSEALQESVQEGPPRHLAGQIDKSVHALVSMFDELLDVSRLDAGVVEMRWQNFELQPMLDRLYVDFAPVAQEKNLFFNIDAGHGDASCGDERDGHVVYSDPFLLERMLRNLISNAIRYTEAGKVELRCTCEHGQIRFDVEDTGSGISAEDLPHIFEEYYQVGNSHRDRRKGLGLGLAIVRRVQELLEYKVAVVSEPGKGSVFSFEVAVGDHDNLSHPFMHTHSAHDLGGMEVILLEDDPDIRQIIVALMEQWGCRVIAGDLPLEVTNRRPSGNNVPDLLVSDYRLPGGMTAVQAIGQLREHWEETIPAIVLTGDTGPEMLNEIRASGALLLHKPITPGRLRSFMYRALHGEN